MPEQDFVKLSRSSKLRKNNRHCHKSKGASGDTRTREMWCPRYGPCRENIQDDQE